VGGWTLSIFLDPKSDEPVYLQIAHALMREIDRGRLKGDDELPGYRSLAEQLGVSRNTVMAAYAELKSEGWIVSRPGEGSAVAPRPPAHAPPSPGKAAGAPPIGFDLVGQGAAMPAGAPGRMLEVASGVADLRLLPGAALARAYRRAVTLAPDRSHPVRDPQGHLQLRQALCRMLAGTRAIAAAPERVLITRGSQMALVLAAQALFAPGDAVAVEALGGRGAWEAFARAGARCLPVPVDGGGIQVDQLERLLAAGPLRAVLVTPQRQYPTLAALAPERRTRLLELAAAHRFAVLEVDQDPEFQFDGRPLAPLAAQDGNGVVVHLGTLSKIFSPDLRLGFVHGPLPLVQRMGELRTALDGHGDPALERAMAELMEDGELQRHLNRMLQVYRRRRDALAAALRNELGDVLTAETPSGGLALWARTRAGLDVDAWAARSLERGVAFRPGRQFAFDGAPVAALRVGFSNYPEPQLEEVARRMRSALPA
jgi:GntR family transcriptional regulator/MocR family aminotransferase